MTLHPILLNFLIYEENFIIFLSVYYTANTQYRKFETNITRNEIARSRCQFLHSCICVRFLYPHDRPAYLVLQNSVDGLILVTINLSQICEC
jgi:hypothetical protein